MTQTHTAKIVKAYIANKGWIQLDHPPQSPDLNPIENLWSIINQNCKDRAPRNENELFKLLKSAWENLDLDVLKNFLTRCQLDAVL